MTTSTDVFVTFKNVGVREYAVNQTTAVVSQSIIPIGIKTPVVFGQRDEGLFAMNTTLSDQIQDNLKNLLLTNHGERLAMYYYGGNLKPLATEYSSIDNFDEEAMVRINTAVTKYMPFVELQNFRSEVVLENNRYTGVIKLYVQYGVPKGNIPTRTLEVTIYAI